MSVIEKLGSVVAAVSPLSSKSTPTDVIRASAKALDLLRDHGPAIRQAMIDAERLDWLGDEGADRQCFIGMDGRWTVQDGFSMWGGGTLREAIDAARATGEGGGHD